ncbi:MAG: aldehyde dehydrogenase family protein, partial [Planctomycetes bacterium]|nr:aldehyde dehydrogenase family protein [Planctomycetota bacterium]
MSALEGMHFVAGRVEQGGGEPFHGIDPKSGAELAPAYREATGEQIERAAQAAGAAAAEFAATSPQQRAALLRAIGDGLDALGDTLVERCSAETALPAARINGERA